MHKCVKEYMCSIISTYPRSVVLFLQRFVDTTADKDVVSDVML